MSQFYHGNGKGLSLPLETRKRKQADTLATIAELEGKEVTDPALAALARKFEDQTLKAVATEHDYHERIARKLARVCEVRSQPAGVRQQPPAGAGLAVVPPVQRGVAPQYQPLQPLQQQQQQQQHLPPPPPPPPPPQQQQQQQQQPPLLQLLLPLPDYQPPPPPDYQPPVPQQQQLQPQVPPATPEAIAAMTGDQRAHRAELLRQHYENGIQLFVRHGTALLEKLSRARSSAETANSTQVRKLFQFVREGHNALTYMDRCHTQGHVPSAPSLVSLERTLVKVMRASLAVQEMIGTHWCQGTPLNVRQPQQP